MSNPEDGQGVQYTDPAFVFNLTVKRSIPLCTYLLVLAFTRGGYSQHHQAS